MMKRPYRKLILSALVLATTLCSAFGATYFIDFNALDDSASGTAKTTPWKRCPGMMGFGHSGYTHQAGDRFIFKGAVTWSGCFPMTVTNSGTSASNQDFYGADQTWFSGSSFVRPIFDFGHTIINGGRGMVASGVMFNGSNFVTVDSIDFANHRAALDQANFGGASTFGAFTIVLTGRVLPITFHNCIIRDWDLTPPITDFTDQASAGGVFEDYGTIAGTGVITFDTCEFTQQGVTAKTGNCFHASATVTNCHFHHAVNGILGGQGDLYNNEVDHMVHPGSDPQAHGNGFYVSGRSTIVGNLFHDNHDSGLLALTMEPGSSNQNSTSILANNVFWNNDATVDLEPLNGSTNTVKIFNNTFQSATYCIRATSRGGGSQRWKVIELANNHYITPSTALSQIDSTTAITVTNHGNDITQVPAASQGYGISNLFQPVTGTAATVNHGENLAPTITTDRLGVARPQGSAWDVGAYEFVGRTFYCSFSSGSNSNSGTSTSSPWKYCPGMQGFSPAGGYAHQAGDRFIFKGGDTWTACWPLTITNSGTTTNPDYYGTDQTWFTGGSWSRAVFDFENNFTSAGYGVGINANNVTFGDGMDLKRLKSPTFFGGGGTITANGQFSGIRVTGALIRDWCLATPITDGNGGNGGGVYAYNGASVSIDHCELTQLNSATKNGAATYNVGSISFTEVHDCAEALHGGGNYHDISIHDLVDGTDPTIHQCAITCFSPSTIYNAVIYNLTTRNAPMEMGTFGNLTNRTDLIYNCLIYNAGGQNAIWSKISGQGDSSYALKVYNTTVQTGGSYCVAATTGDNNLVQTGPIGRLEVRNCHLITTAPTAILHDDPPNHGAYVTNLVLDHNLSQTPSQATSAGYTSGNAYQPTSGAAPTVDTGIDLSSLSLFTTDRLGNPRGATWDRGAYEYTGAAPPAPTPTPTPTPTATPSPTPSPTPGTDVLVNGNFEQGPFDTLSATGWTVGGTGRIEEKQEGATTQSHSAAFSTGGDTEGSTLSQTVNTSSGRPYSLDFDAGIFGTTSSAPSQIRAQVTGASSLVDSTVSPPYTGSYTASQIQFRHYHYEFTANSSSTTITFTDVGLGNPTADLVLDTVTLSLSPPAAPINPTPASGATGVSINTGFSWTGDSNATSYDIKLGTTNPPSIAQSGLTVTSYTRPVPLAYSTLYYMSVTAHGPGGNTDSALWSFTTESKPIIFPTVSLTAPANGVTYIAPATINLAATATDSDGSVTKVEFYNGATLLGQDLTSPYSLSLTNVPVGDYSYIAKATDNDGNPTSSTPVAVHVMAPPQFPVVNLSAPVDGSVYTNAPATIAFAATAADADGTVTKVEFYNGSTKIGEDTTSPYAYNWPSVGAGTYAVKARAIDNSGNATDTAVANITVTLPNAVVVPKVIMVVR